MPKNTFFPKFHAKPAQPSKGSIAGAAAAIAKGFPYATTTPSYHDKMTSAHTKGMELLDWNKMPSKGVVNEFKKATVRAGHGTARSFPDLKGKATISVHQTGIAADVAHVTNVHSQVKGEGNASKELTRVTAIADKQGVRLSLFPAASKDEPGALSQGQLEMFYRRHGFVPTEDQPALFIREPEGGVKKATLTREQKVALQRAADNAVAKLGGHGNPYHDEEGKFTDAAHAHTVVK